MSICAFIQGVDIKKFVKIGRPGYRVTKQRDAENGQQSLLFEVTFKYNFKIREKYTLVEKKCKIPVNNVQRSPKLLARPVQFSADVYNHYVMKQRSLFIAPLVVIYCRELALHHRPQGAT